MALAALLGVPVQRVNELVRGKRGVTPATAWLLAQALGTTPEYWVNLQTAHDLARSRPAVPVEPLRVASRVGDAHKALEQMRSRSGERHRLPSIAVGMPHRREEGPGCLPTSPITWRRTS